MVAMHQIGADAAVTIRAQGAKLAGRLTLPPGAVRAAVVLHPATGAPAGFYSAFATWLAAERDCAVLTYDYRDLGASATARTFWQGPMPWLAGAMGYLPGARLGLGADLPLGIYRDWRRWCLTRGFQLSDIGRRFPMHDPALVTANMRVVAIADDPMVPPPAVWRLMALYPKRPSAGLSCDPLTLA